MMIRIMYNHGGFDIVKPALLDALLEQSALISFKRSDGWAVVGRDPIRSQARSEYRGPERRQTRAEATFAPAAG